MQMYFSALPDARRTKAAKLRRRHVIPSAIFGNMQQPFPTSCKVHIIVIGVRRQTRPSLQTIPTPHYILKH